MVKRQFCILKFFYFFIFCNFLFAQKKNPYLEEGEKAFARGAYDKALEALEKAINLGEESGRAHFFIGQIYEARKKYREAIPYYAKAVEKPLEKNYKITTLWKLIILTKEFGQSEDCLRYIGQLEALGVRHENLEKIKLEIEALLSPERKEALLLLQEIEDREKEISPYRNQENFYRLYREEIATIAQKFEKVYRLQPKDSEYLWKAAFYYEKIQDTAKALELYQELTLITEEAYKAWYKIGTLERRQGNFHEALAAFSKAIPPKKSNQTLEYQVHVQKAQSFFGLENFPEAAAEAKLALKTKTNEFFPLVLYCLSLIKTEQEDATCKNLKPIKNFASSVEKTVFYLYFFEKNLKNQEYIHAKLFAQKAFLEEAIQNEEDEKLPKWLEGELKNAFNFFWEIKEYSFLWQMKERYAYAFVDENSWKKLAFAAAELKNWNGLYQSLQNLPKEEEYDTLWEKALLELGYFNELSDFLWEKYGHSHEKMTLLEKKLDEITWARFAISAEGKKLKEKLKTKKFENQ